MSRFILVKSFNNPEVEAMLQALYSRSHASIKDHLEELGIPLVDEEDETGRELKKRLSKYYIGYGHDSIGDCASATVFIENVSIIAAKAIENIPLYNGQESSTRYIDFQSKKKPLADLIKHLAQRRVIARKTNVDLDSFNDALDKFLDEYYAIYEEVKNFIIKRETDLNGDVASKKAIEAYAFDVARGFLPSGTLTQLSFHGTLRTLKTHFSKLRSHYLLEVREIALEVLTQLCETYPHAFEKELLVKETPIFSKESCYNGNVKGVIEKYRKTVADINGIMEVNKIDKFIILNDIANINAYQESLEEFPGLTNHNETNLLPLCGYFNSDQFIGLDYGSWRDLQRHRNGFILPVIPSMDVDKLKDGSEKLLTIWYVKALAGGASKIEGEVKNILDRFADLIIRFSSEYEDLFPMFPISYITPMGKSVPVVFSYNIEEIDYVLKLRLQETVHGSLVNFLLDIQTTLAEKLPYFKRYDDKQSLRNKTYSLKRGKQDILKDNKSIGG